MLRIKRSVQAAFNTEASYVAAQAASARLGAKAKAAAADDGMDEDEAADPMAALEGGAGAATKGPSFVAAKQKTGISQSTVQSEEVAAPEANPDESESFILFVFWQSGSRDERGRRADSRRVPSFFFSSLPL